MNLTTLLKQIFFLLAFLVGSFVLIHFLALFGVFLALAIPLLHLVFYPHILCFWCRLTNTHHNLKHSLIDSGLTLVLTLLSVGIVYGEYQLISKFKLPETPQIAHFTIPTKNQYSIGEVFPVPIDLERIPAAINVFQADLSFDPKLIEVVDLTTDGTFASFFVQKEYDNDKGYVRLSGGIPNPGYRQATGRLGTVYFRGKASGATQLSYLESSLVLANDGRGTNLLADYPQIPLIILPTDTTQVIPSDMTIRTQIKGDTDKTVLSFSEYANDLPKPFDNTLGESVAPPSPIATAPTIPTYNKPEHPLLRFDKKVLEYWDYFFNLLKIN